MFLNNICIILYLSTVDFICNRVKKKKKLFFLLNIIKLCKPMSLLDKDSKPGRVEDALTNRAMVSVGNSTILVLLRFKLMFFQVCKPFES